MNKVLFSVLVAIFLICGCSGGSDSSSTPVLPIGPGGASMSGQWEGSLTFENGQTEQVNLVEFEQDGANLSGAHEWVLDGNPNRTPDVSGTIANSTVTISAIYRDPNSTDYLEFAYNGTVNGDVFSGSFRLTGSIPNHPNYNEGGTFSFSRVGGDPQPNPQPNQLDMSGRWSGMMSTPESGLYNTIFELEDTDGRISGRFTYSPDQGGEPQSTENLIGTVENSTARIIVTLFDANGNEIVLTFEGTLRADSYDGGITVQYGEVLEQGTFTTARNQDRRTMSSEVPSAAEEDFVSEIQQFLDDISNSDF